MWTKNDDSSLKVLLNWKSDSKLELERKYSKCIIKWDSESPGFIVP